MVDPVIAADGHSYEREAIQRRLLLGNSISPETNVQLRSENLSPNHRLRVSIEYFLEQMPRSQINRKEMQVSLQPRIEADGLQLWPNPVPPQPASSSSGTGVALALEDEEVADDISLNSLDHDDDPLSPSGMDSSDSLVEISATRFVRSGWLLKRSRYVRQWRWRWTTLSTATLQTFKDEKLQGLTEDVELHHISGARAENVRIIVQLGNRRDIVFVDSTARGAGAWASAIDLKASEARRRVRAVKELQTSFNDVDSLRAALEEAKRAGIDEELIRAGTLDLSSYEDARSNRLRAAEQDRSFRAEQDTHRPQQLEDDVRQWERRRHVQLAKQRQQQWLAEEQKRGQRTAEEWCQWMEDGGEEQVRKPKPEQERLATSPGDGQQRASGDSSEDGDSLSGSDSAGSDGGADPAFGQIIRICVRRYGLCLGDCVTIVGESQDGKNWLTEGGQLVPKSHQDNGWEYIATMPAESDVLPADAEVELGPCIRVFENRYGCLAGEVVHIEGVSDNERSWLIQGGRQVPKSQQGRGWQVVDANEINRDDLEDDMPQGVQGSQTTSVFLHADY